MGFKAWGLVPTTKMQPVAKRLKTKEQGTKTKHTFCDLSAWVVIAV